MDRYEQREPNPYLGQHDSGLTSRPDGMLFLPNAFERRIYRNRAAKVKSRVRKGFIYAGIGLFGMGLVGKYVADRFALEETSQSVSLESKLE